MRTMGIAAALALQGCYSSSLTGDAGTDTARDTAIDTAWDTAHDTAADGPHDAPVDAPCMPGSGVTVGFDVSGFPAYGTIDVELACFMEDSWEDPGDGLWGILLGCPSDEGLIEEHLVTFTADPYLQYPYPPADDLVLRYVREDMWPGARWLTLTAGGGWLVAAAAEAWTHAPPGHDAEEWYAPLALGAVTGICPAEPTECGPLERMGIEIRTGSSRGVVLDGGHGIVGSPIGPQVLVSVESAWQYLDLMCDGPPSTWYDFGFTVPPSM